MQYARDSVGEKARERVCERESKRESDRERVHARRKKDGWTEHLNLLKAT